ncbi:MAG: VWA domain-containing protein, partial [Akkermansiaceae bacterium]|nr:VWA domain-containing protein [Verrucomicrobiales bacterium]
MIPFLTYPLALMALAALPALAAIYILRNRYRRRQVSSLMLWNFRVQSKEGGAKVNRLQLPLIFFLELLALLLLVTAAAGPHWKLAQASRPLIVILDDSFSMRAVSENRSAQARAREALEKLFRFQAPPSTRLILAGSEPRLLGASAKSWSEVEKLLAQWHCWSPSAEINLAITLASEVGKQQANILVLTDHAPAETKSSNARLQWRSFGAAVDNLAIVNASRTANGDEDRCLLEIANFSKTPQ